MAQPVRTERAPRKQRRLFRPHEAAQVAEDKRSCERAMRDTNVLDKPAVHRALKRLGKMEEEHSVPQLTPQQKDQAKKRILELEGKMKNGMLSHEEMRRNPPGAVDQNIWWEKQNKRRVNEWKNLQLALNAGIPDDQARDLVNVERLRPRVSHLNMAGAQIPATTAFSFPSDAYKENFDQIFTKKEEPGPEFLEEPEAEEPAPLIEEG